MNWLRRIASWMLLAAYLPLVVLSSLHVHHETIDTHDNCLQCSGHYEEQHNHQNDCQYCHFLSQSYLGQSDGHSVIIFSATDRIPAITAGKTKKLRCGVILLRAPPVV